MALPDFTSTGDLPPGVHPASLEEVVARFGSGTARRQIVTETLRRIYALVRATGELQRFIIFGSYITAKPEPNDVDIVLLMADGFRPGRYDEATQQVFDHQQAAAHFGASIFWTSPLGLLLVEDVGEFLASWGIKRDRTWRGVVEVIS
jgi:hypothetical protein